MYLESKRARARKIVEDVTSRKLDVAERNGVKCRQE